MNYPFWEPGVSYGVLMAAIAVFHVFISHFAVGGGLYLVLTEHYARRRKNQPLLDYLHRLSKFFILVTLVTGALSGLGIWFIIGLLNPLATQVLIRQWVWGWAIEWTFFFVEIAAAILYYYGWKRMSARDHLTIGWIYFVAAYLSLVVINGIITFMLTPGDWLETGALLDGFFNPTYWPSLVMRTGITLAMAGLFCLFYSTCRRTLGDQRSGLIRFNAIWCLLGLIIAAASFVWYQDAIPAEVMAAAQENMAIPMTALDINRTTLLILAGLLGLFGLLLPGFCRIPVSTAMMITGFIWFGSFEWFRESIRKPYAIAGYVYGNGLLVSKTDTYRSEGLLAHMPIRTGDDGADLFNRACASCHTLDGYNGLRERLEGLDEAYVTHLVAHTKTMRGNMPPFPGTPEEAGKIARHLLSKFSPAPLEELKPLTGVGLGQEVFRRRCGTCHVPGGYNDVTDTITSFEEDEEFEYLVETAGELADEMPPFTGTEIQRQALIEYLKTMKEATP